MQIFNSKGTRPENGRIAWIDTAKAIGIFLVVLGHLNLPKGLYDAIYTFHMPLFFVLAGMTFNGELPFALFLKKKFKALVIPYFFFSAIFFAFWLFVGRHYGVDAGSGPSVPESEVILQIFYGIGSSLYPTPLWFLTCLFMTEILFYFFVRQDSQKMKVVELLLILSAGLTYEHFSPTLLPRLFWNIDFAMYYLPFVALGYYAFNSGFFNRKNIKQIAVVSFMACGAVFAISNNLMTGLHQHWYNSVLTLIPAVAGCAAAVSISIAIPGNAPMNFLGKNTLALFALHLIGLNILKGILHFVLQMDLAILDGCIAYNILLALACLVLLAPAAMFLQKFSPWTVGHK